ERSRHRGDSAYHHHGPRVPGGRAAGREGGVRRLPDEAVRAPPGPTGGRAAAGSLERRPARGAEGRRLGRRSRLGRSWAGQTAGEGKSAVCVPMAAATTSRRSPPRPMTDDQRGAGTRDEGSGGEPAVTGKYVYCIAETTEALDLGPIGIGGPA